MRLHSISRLSLMAIVVCTLFSCNEKEEFATEKLSDYIPLNTGKYITYRIDSTVYTAFGTITEVHSFQVKHVIDALITDNNGRPAYRVYRYLRDTAGLQSWQPSGSYYITPLPDQVEVTEDNLRFIKLHLPIRNGFSWKGNKFLPNDPYGPAGYSFSNDNFMEFWDFTYDNFSPSFSYRGNNFSNVYSVAQADEKDLVDTFRVSATNQVQIPANKIAGWIAGNSTGLITVNADAPSNGFEMRIYNSSNNSLKLNGITTPSGYSRNYRYNNGQWGLGNNGKDTLYTDTPPGFKNYALEKYAKNIGLVYKQYELWEYQPNIGNPSGAYKIGFGITMWMIDHN
ncbi:MAG: hypothetical protein IPI68_00365 [Chitinophagaceae bacterium]|nr:hypothetical protein [Chitinophagaceae bacterium]